MGNCVMTAAKAAFHRQSQSRNLSFQIAEAEAEMEAEMEEDLARLFIHLMETIITKSMNLIRCHLFMI